MSSRRGTRAFGDGARQRCWDAARGTVYAEFLIAFTPFFLLFLGGVQLALIAQARIVVQHAASCAVRAAVVSIDDDPVFYDDGERKVLSTQGSGSGQDTAQGVVEGLAETEFDGNAKSDSQGSARLNRVRNAAYLPLSVISPSYQQLFGWVGRALGDGETASVADAVGDAPLMRVLTGLALYGRMASAVTFPKARGADELRDPNQPWPDHAPVRVRVTYLFPCSVPIVRALACQSLPEMQIASQLASAQRALGDEQRRTPAEQALEELKQAESASMQKGLYALFNERFIALRGEAALPNQGAAYRYPSELCKTKKRAPGVDCGGGP
jgi:hypothetical protein